MRGGSLDTTRVPPAGSHDAITYPFALTKAGDNPEARALMTFLQGPKARAVFVQRGFKVE